jgi:outer membrane protein OmpA-like peptidoglycan-associated protein
MVKRDKKLSLFFYPDIYNKLYSMIKQTWEISNEERNRILSLHESATKNFYLMSEQDSSVQGVKKVFEIDENYTYWLSQVSYSRGGGYVDWTKNYFIFATDNQSSRSYQCKILEKNQKGIATKIEVLTDKPIPNLFEDSDMNEFIFSLKKTSKKTWAWGRYNEMTQKSYLGPEMEGDLQTGKWIYAVVIGGVPQAKPVDEERSGRYGKNYSINFDELEIGSVTPFNLETQGFISKYYPSGFGLFMPTTVSSYPIPPDFFKDPTPSKKPEFEEIKLDIQSPFEFDKTTLTPDAEIEFKKFIEKVKSNYQGVSGSVEVIASASIDGDEDQKRDYNQKLSDNRANTIANRLKTETGISTLNFIPKGIGQTDQFAKGMKYPEVKDVNQTAPNRRLIIKMPTLTKEKQK